MNHYIRYFRFGFPVALLSIFVFIGCNKSTPHNNTGGGNNGGGNNGGTGGSGNNKCPTGLKLTASDTTPTKGVDVGIKTNVDGPLFQWAGPDNFSLSANGGQDSITIAQIRIYQSGWYYCAGSEPNCNSIFDSVYIDVNYQQGTPSCTLTNDQMSNTAGLPDFTGGTILKSYSGSYNCILLDVEDGGATEYDFLFNPNNGNTEPKDGVYYTTDYSFSDSNIDADAISLTINYFPYFLNSDGGQKVYVSHVNGKLRISFCSLKCEGSGASGLFTGQVTEQ